MYDELYQLEEELKKLNHVNLNIFLNTGIRLRKKLFSLSRKIYPMLKDRLIRI